MLLGQPNNGGRDREAVSWHTAWPHLRAAECRQTLPGRVAGGEGSLSTDYASNRTGLPGSGRNKRRHRQNQRFNRSVTSSEQNLHHSRVLALVSIGLLVCGLSCRGSHSNPAEAYAHAHSLFVQGDLN